MNFYALILSALMLFAIDSHAAKKRVLILYSTGGHATAAKSVEHLLNEYPDEFEVIRHDFSDDLTGFARWFYLGGYDFISRHANWINKFGLSMKWKQSDQKPLYSSQRFDAEFNQPENILTYVKSVNPDVIICTHFSIAETLANLREHGAFKEIPIAWTHLDVVSNTFFKQIGDQLDMSFLPTEEMMREWEEVIDSKKLSAIGIPIMPEMLDHPERPRSTEDTPTVLLLGGSMGALSYIEIIRQISSAMTASGHLDVRYIAVCGRNTLMQRKLEAWEVDHKFPIGTSVETKGFVDTATLRGLQAASDLIISKPGGLTTFELMTSERPIILTEPIGLQEYYNARYINDQGAGLFLPTTAGIGLQAMTLMASPSGVAQVENQRKIRAQFHLERIVEWVRHSTVNQLERPPTTIFEKMHGLKNATTDGMLKKICQILLSRH